MSTRAMIRPKTAALVVLALAAEATAQTIGGLASPLSAGDPAAARAVMQPAAIRAQPNAALGHEVISGATDDDAIDATAERLRAAGGGASYVKTDAGLGIVGVGSASLPPATAATNRNLVEPQRRFARVEALLASKLAIAALLEGTSEAGIRELGLQRALLDDRDFDPQAAPAATTVTAFLRGAVLYDCQEDANGERVFVTTVTTPRTQGDISFDAIDAVTASNLRAAKDLMVTEIRSGVIPPVGGRMLTVLGDARCIAFLGWSCEYVDYHPDERTRRQIFETAAAQSQVDARGALLAVMRGERVSYSRAFESVVPEFEKRSAATNPGTGQATSAATRVQHVESFLGKETMTSVIAGTLPRGVQVTAPEAIDGGTFVFTIAFYSPETAAAADSVWPQVAATSPLGKSDRRARSYVIAPDGTFETTRDGKLKPKSAATGQVSNKKDL